MDFICMIVDTIAGCWKIMGDNAGQIQIVIAVLAIGYVIKQIKFSSNQRTYDLRLKRLDSLYEYSLFIDNSLHKIRETLYYIDSHKTLDEDKYNKEELMDIRERICDLGKQREFLIDLKPKVDEMIFHMGTFNILSINELEQELKDSLEDRKLIKSISSDCDVLLFDIENLKPIK